MSVIDPRGRGDQHDWDVEGEMKKMRSMGTRGIGRMLAIAAVCVIVGELAGAETGRWRVEASGSANVHSSKTDRDGDSFYTGSVEYEWYVLKQSTLGLRFYPLFYYNGPEDIYGTGLGVTARHYHNENRDGFFEEAGAAPLWLSRYLEDNSSRVNFLLEAGLGYQFPDTGVHVTLSVQHISNAGLGSENAGANGVGLAVGYTF